MEMPDLKRGPDIESEMEDLRGECVISMAAYFINWTEIGDTHGYIPYDSLHYVINTSMNFFLHANFYWCLVCLENGDMSG